MADVLMGRDRSKVVQKVIDQGVVAIIACAALIFIGWFQVAESRATRAELSKHVETTAHIARALDEQAAESEKSATREKYTCINTAILAKKPIEQAIRECQ